MYISDPEPKKRVVSDLDFTFNNGIFMPVTVDKEAGDSVEYPTPETIVIHLTAKPGQDGLSLLPAEDITVFVKNILTIQHREREVTELTQTQKAEWQKTFQELTTQTVQ